MKAKLLLVNSQRALLLFVLMISAPKALAQQLQRVITEPWYDNAFHNGGVENYHYDANGLLVDTMNSLWYSDQNLYVDLGQQFITHDASGRVLNREYKHYDEDTAQWNYTIRWCNTYDANGNILVELYETCENGVWSPFSREVKQYDSENRLISNTGQRWISDNGVWVDGIRSTYTYNSDGIMLQEYTDEWNNLDAWINPVRVIFTYNAAGKKLNEIREGLEGTVWHPVAMDFYEYDANNQCILSSSMSRNAADDGWVLGGRRNIYAYNADGSLAEMNIQLKHNDTWDNHYRYTYVYNLLAVNEFNHSAVAVYPNPAKDIITVSGCKTQDYTISDQTGRIVTNGRLENNQQQINISSLPTGIYFFRNAQTVFKIIKE